MFGHLALNIEAFGQKNKSGSSNIETYIFYSSINIELFLKLFSHCLVKKKHSWEISGFRSHQLSSVDSGNPDVLILLDWSVAFDHNILLYVKLQGGILK